MNGLTKAAQDVLAERQRQIEHEHYTHAHDDDEHETGALAYAASGYALQAGRCSRGYIGASLPPPNWPWGDLDWKPKDARSNLVKAGALILAEIERLDRAAGTSGGSASDSVPVPPSPAPVVQVVEPRPSDTQLLDWLEQQRNNARAKDFQWDTWQYDAMQSERTIREQLADEVKRSARKWGLSLKEPRE